MSWPSGLFSGRFMRSMSTTSRRLTATSSGASTSLARLPEMSRILRRSIPMVNLMKAFSVGIVSARSFQKVKKDTGDVDQQQQGVPDGHDPDGRRISQARVETTETQARTDQDRHADEQDDDVAQNDLVLFGLNHALQHAAFAEGNGERSPDGEDVRGDDQSAALTGHAFGRRGDAARAEVK